MQIAVLFWCYKDPALCRRRLDLLRRHDPAVPVYALYGGPADEAAAMQTALTPVCDDFWVFAEDRSPHWKWRHGDLMIAAWHRARGQALAWDHLLILQWDMVVAAPVSRLLAGLGADQLLLSGVRPVAQVRDWWGWVRGDQPDQKPEFEAFAARLRDDLGYVGPLYACLFIVVGFPRRFLDRYAGPEVTELGFLEYKIPSLAAAWGFAFWTDHPFVPWWASNPATREAPEAARVLNAVGHEIRAEVMRQHLSAPEGARLFHPVRDPATDEALADLLRRPAGNGRGIGGWLVRLVGGRGYARRR